MLSELERARRAYLLVICARPDVMVARDYVQEKVTRIYRCTEVWEIRNMLDLNEHRAFNDLLAATTL